MRIVVISSFVLPHAGGVEQFVATIRGLLEAPGTDVRVVACRPPGGGPTSADVALPARYLGGGGWPLPTGGWGAAWREIRGADVVIANNARQPLSVAAVVGARAVGVPALLVVHGAGAGPANGSGPVRAARRVFERSAGRLAARCALTVSVSRAGVDGARRAYGVRARYLPYPVARLPEAAATVPVDGPALRVVWVGRLHPEKDPILAVRAVQRLRERRPWATLEVYGDGPLRAELERLAAAGRPWLALRGERPWSEVVDAQGAAHVCLSTSRADNVQVAVLEALTRGIPTVATAVGDAPSYFGPAALRHFCPPPGDAEALAAALDALADGYPVHRGAFAQNAQRLRAVHDGAAQVLDELIAHAGGPTRPTP